MIDSPRIRRASYASRSGPLSLPLKGLELAPFSKRHFEAVAGGSQGQNPHHTLDKTFIKLYLYYK